MQAGDDSTRERLRVDADSAVWTLRVDADGNSLDVWDGWAFTAAAMNGVIDDLLRPTTELSRVLAAAAEGDLSQRMPHPPVGSRPPGELGSLSTSVNSLLERLSAVADEVTRVAREVGTDGRLGGQAEVPGVAGTWRDLTDSVNFMADNLTGQVRNIAQVTTAVARGDLTQKINVDARGEILELKNTINTMVDQLSDFADEVTRVAREVGTEGILGGQARVRNVAGTWHDLTDSVNFMADNLTGQVRNIAQVTTAIARGDLTQKINVDARGEILELKNTINTTVDRLSDFGDEVTRVAREVGTEGKLGGQAEVEGVSGTWQRLTESVNRLASNLTTQVRAIATVATAVTTGDLTQQITVDASGEILELKNNINQMIANLEETTRANLEQDWLKTNLARVSALMQGHRDIAAMGSLILSELAPLVTAQQGAFFLARSDEEGALERVASYGAPAGDGMPNRFRRGESLVGQAAVDRRTILIEDAPPDYFRISSGLGTTAPGNVIVLPLLFEGEPLGVIEL
ncbi:MAG: HAMP domain-containing protein, partial [Micromonosporaceae bacterium]